MSRICIIRQGYYPFDARVRKEALSLVSKGHEVDVICMKGTISDAQKSTDVHRGVKIYRLPLDRSRKGISKYIIDYLSFFVMSNFKLCQLHFRNKYDFIQVNTLPDFLVFVTLLPKLAGAKVVLDLHEPAPELFGTIFGSDRKCLISAIEFFEKASIRYADRVITVSDEMKRNFVKRGAPESKISVILNVPNLEFRPEFYNKERDADSVKSNRFSLICHGAVIKRYGQYIAIKAMSILKEQNPSIHLDILGEGEYMGELRKLVAELHLEDRVHIHGFIPFEDMFRMVARADLGIVPVEKNPYSDLVHTNKMFELIAMKKPVVISRTTAVENFFGTDDSCLKYFESGNEKELAKCVVELYRNPEKRKSMTENAFKKFESVRWDIQKEDYCKLFQ